MNSLAAKSTCEESAAQSALAQFERTVNKAVEAFPSSSLLQRLQLGTLQMSDYHLILTTLFHQTYSSPYTFARAAVNCSWHHEAAKEFLLRHADEERTHWRWILNDLDATGYRGTPPRSLPPHHSAQAFIGLNYFLAEECPVSRLAVACVVEGIGAKYGSVYGGKLLAALNLDKSQASFFINHGQTDIQHTAELRSLVESLSLSANEWQWMHHAAEVAGRFYRGMYEHDSHA
ncbi:MAG TPA: iron-containing redox enzyme family protein [Steroidobacteraceae bacterium]|nr:iron-containing redox enzyme family protein [Steroidobacteraceae bacterium]